MIPEQFGRYIVINKLGQGGMAEVFLAEDPVMKRQVAIKVLPTGPSLDDTSSLRFYQEVETIATLEHPAIVPIYDVGDEGGRPFFVMRHMTGGKLTHHLAQGPLPTDMIIEIMRRLAGALDKAHRAGIVHRDLKPDNVLLDEDGKAYLSDFGIAKLLASNTALTTNQAILGTLEYMSPEQLQSVQVDGSSDIYALGVLLYHMLVGRPPYAGTLGEIISQHLSPEPPNILKVRPDLPPACERVIAQAMAQQKTKRFASAMEMAEALAVAFGRSLDPSEPVLPKWQPEIAAPPFEGPPSYSRLTGLLPQPVLTTSLILQRQLKRLPTWVRWSLIVVPLLLAAYFIIPEVSAWLFPTSPTAVPTPLFTTTATPPATTPTLIVTTTTIPTVSGAAIGDVLRIVQAGDGAILQIGAELQRISTGSRIPIPAAPNTVTLQTDVSRLELLLPDSTKFYMAGNTKLVFVTIAGMNGAVETAVQLQNGRLAIELVGTAVAIIGPDGQQARTLMGLTGVETDSSLRLVCLKDQCSFAGQSSDPISVFSEQAVSISADNVLGEPVEAQIEPYMSLLNPIAAPPTETHTATPTSTITPTPTATIDATRMGPEVTEIGNSVLGTPIEAVRFGDGPEVFIFAAGLQGGYSPNAVMLAEEMITHLSANLQLIPERATLYIIANNNPDSPAQSGQVEGRLNANGVDLNRNWECNWLADPWILTRRVEGGGGTEPYSEPETAALVNFIVAQEPTAVLFWMAHRQSGLVSPGSCQSPRSRVSQPLSQLYATAANYSFYTAQEDVPDAAINGDASNSLDQQGIPSVSVLLPLFDNIDWEENLAGTLAVLNDYAAPSAPTPLLAAAAGGSTTTCLQTVESRWMNSSLYTEFSPVLGCALTGEQYPEATFQLYEAGLMVWRRDTQKIYVLYNDGSFMTYAANLTVGAGFSEDARHQGPMGYLWKSNLFVQGLLGDPLNSEMGTSEFTLQEFRNGTIFYFRENLQNSYVLLPNLAEVRFVQEE